MSSINVTIRPELSVLLNYVSNKEERCSQWPFNGRNFQAYGFGVEVIRSLTYKDTVDRQTRHDKNIVPTALLLDNSDGDTMQLEFNDEKLIVSRTHTVTRLHQDLIQGDVIQTLNEVTSPTFDMMYNIMCRGETLEMKIIRGDGELLVDHIPKRAKLLKHDTRLDINCLPDAVFELVSSFIPTFVDRLLLAGAVCMPSTSIIGIEPVRELDFVEVDKKVAARLNDNDIRRMLICIDAVNNIVSLKLTNCFRVVGHGLEPLKGSTVLELIDLSLVTKHANPNIHKKSLISEIAVLPVLESIMARGRLCNLKCVQYPEKWIGSSLLGHFQFRLGESRSIRHHCVSCQQEKSNNELLDACYLCLEHVCLECVERNRVEDPPYNCYNCKKTYCHSCVSVGGPCESNNCGGEPYCEICSQWCSQCGSNFCNKCANFGNCDNCGVLYCGHHASMADCIGGHCDECQWNYCNSCSHVNRCYYCNKTCCSYCIEDAKSSDVLHCICHDKEICSECLTRREDHSSLCQDCVARVNNYLDGCLWR